MGIPRAVVSFALVLVLSASGPIAEPATLLDGAELRSAPGFSGAVLARPRDGASVEVLERSREWARVRLPAGTEGWLHEHFLASDSARVVEAPTAAPPVVTAGEVAAGSTPDLAAENARLREGMAYLQGELARVKPELAALRMRQGSGDHALASCELAAASAAARANAMQAERDRLARDVAMLSEIAAESPAAAATPDLDVMTQIELARQEGARQADQKCAEDLAPTLEAAINDALHAMLSEEQESERRRMALEAQRTELEARHAEATAELEREHQELFEKYVQLVTQRHDETLAREREALRADCEARLVTERRESERRVSIARRESGWEAEFERDVRERVEADIEEARVKWQAKQRGEQYDEERVRREERAAARKDLETERLTAVSQALALSRTEMEARVRQVREEADMRCQVALQLVLERAAEGGDLSGVRAMARSPGPEGAAPEPTPVPAEPVPVAPATEP